MNRVTAQNRTNIWELGYAYTENSPKCELKYVSGEMDTSAVYRQMMFFITDASICDTDGNLLFYTNGITIDNRNYDTLQNSVDFNPGWATIDNDPAGMSNCQGVLILPDPGNMNRYYLFHETGEQFIAYNTYEVQPLHLSYSVVDMTLDGGLGAVVDTLKNQYAIEDTLLWGGLTAVKHANGRDWWIIAHNFYHDKYYKLLLTPEGVQGPFEQTIGSNLMYDVDIQAVFSPDGSKYCISNHRGWFDYFDFDRCSGEFSNYNTGNNYDADSSFYGCSFSPNSRFLYASSLYNLYQYDTWNPNMINDVIHIAQWDSFYEYGADILFFMHQLGPDGKIYLSTWAGSLCFNVIQSPDSLGLACDFQPHSFYLSFPQFNVSIPSFPNYDLGPLEGSACDTLFLSINDIEENKNRYRIYPNPISDYLNIIYNSTDDTRFELYDIFGKRVTTTSLFYYFKNRLVDVREFPAGTYLAVVRKNNEAIWTQKVVIIR